MSVVGPGTPPIPWEDRPAGSRAVVWRSSRNPIIARDLLPRSNSIFNSAVVPFRDGFAGVFRVDDTVRTMNVRRRSRTVADDPSPSGSCPPTTAPPRSRDLTTPRPAQHVARGPLVRDSVQRLPRPTIGIAGRGT
jgi:hypothetical protein